MLVLTSKRSIFTHIIRKHIHAAVLTTCSSSFSSTPPMDRYVASALFSSFVISDRHNCNNNYWCEVFDVLRNNTSKGSDQMQKKCQNTKLLSCLQHHITLKFVIARRKHFFLDATTSQKEVELVPCLHTVDS